MGKEMGMAPVSAVITSVGVCPYFGGLLVSRLRLFIPRSQEVTWHLIGAVECQLRHLAVLNTAEMSHSTQRNGGTL